MVVFGYAQRTCHARPRIHQMTMLSAATYTGKSAAISSGHGTGAALDSRRPKVLRACARNNRKSAKLPLLTGARARSTTSQSKQWIQRVVQR